MKKGLQEILQPLDLIGGRTRTRTLDPLIKSQLLYQLSYAPVFAEATDMPLQFWSGSRRWPGEGLVNYQPGVGNASPESTAALRTGLARGIAGFGGKEEPLRNAGSSWRERPDTGCQRVPVE